MWRFHRLPSLAISMTSLPPHVPNPWKQLLPHHLRRAQPPHFHSRGCQPVSVVFSLVVPGTRLHLLAKIRSTPRRHPPHWSLPCCPGDQHHRTIFVTSVAFPRTRGRAFLELHLRAWIRKKVFLEIRSCDQRLLFLKCDLS